MPNIPVSTPKGYYQNSLHVSIRRDFKRDTGWAFVTAPQYFCANTAQLRDLADAFHEMADQIDGTTAEEAGDT